MGPDGKKGLAALIVKGFPKSSSRVGVGYENKDLGQGTDTSGTDRNDKHMMADEMLSAIHAKDIDSFTDALVGFIKLCETDEGAESTEPSDQAE